MALATLSRLDGALLVLGAAFAYVLAVVVRRRYFSNISDIPGPLLASFSVLWEVWSILQGDINWREINLHRKYGHFVRISHDEVSLSHPDAVRQILLAPLHKTEWYAVIALPDYRFQTPMSERDPKRHVQRAKNIAPGFALSHIIKSEGHINTSIELLKKRLYEHGEARKPVHFNEWFNYLAFDIVGEVLFSAPFGFLESGTDIGGSIANSRVLTLYVTLAGFFQRIHRATLGNPIVSDWKLMPTQHIFDTSLRAIESRLKNPDSRKDMLALWMKQQKENPDKMEERELFGCVNMTVGAGADTVSASLQAFFYHMIRRPQLIVRLRDEIATAGLSDPVISYADASKLPFLQACLKESWRVHTPVALGLGRIAPPQGITIGGHYFAPGTKLSVNPWVIHYSKEIFGEDADEFNPDRWLESRGEGLDKYYIPFGAGYNSCPGRGLAQLEVSKVAATLVRDFDISQVDPTKEWKYEAHFTAVPYGWPCDVRPRAIL